MTRHECHMRQNAFYWFCVDAGIGSEIVSRRVSILTPPHFKLSAVSRINQTCSHTRHYHNTASLSSTIRLCVRPVSIITPLRIAATTALQKMAMMCTIDRTQPQSASQSPVSSTQQHQQRVQWARGVLRDTWRTRRAMRIVQNSALASLSPRRASLPTAGARQAARFVRHLGNNSNSNNNDNVAALQVAAAAHLAAYVSLVGARRAGERTGAPANHPVLPPAPPPPYPSISEATSAESLVDQTSNVCPETYLLRLLEKRGRPASKVSSVEAGYCTPPTAKQVQDYDMRPFMSDMVRRGDLEGLQEALESGRGMDASNKFGESVVHVASRRGNFEVLSFLLQHGGSLTCCDDLGRFPLHEVCWAVEPRFDLVRLFLDKQKKNATAAAAAANLLLVTDKRGCTPLRYVKEYSWPEWRRFLDEVVDEYWPRVDADVKVDVQVNVQVEEARDVVAPRDDSTVVVFTGGAAAAVSGKGFDRGGGGVGGMVEEVKRENMGERRGTGVCSSGERETKRRKLGNITESGRQ